MYHIRFNEQSKRVLTETVMICGMQSISELIRKCANFAVKGRLAIDSDGWVTVSRKNGTVVKMIVPDFYYKKWMK